MIKICGCRSLSFTTILRQYNNNIRSRIVLNNQIKHVIGCDLKFLQVSTKVIKVSVLNNFRTVRTNSKLQETHISLEKLGEAKEQIIAKMNFRCTDDSLPFYKLPFKTLLHVYKVTKNDEENGYCTNRLYYISDKLKWPPSTVSKYIVQRTFLYSLSFDWLQNSLNVLLDMNVSSERIMRDLWVLKYNSKTIHERLQKVKNMGVDNLHPWMVRCSENILNRYIQLFLETKNILGETKSTQIYLANRLNTTISAVDDMCLRIPALRRIRVTKVKQFLDYLISEGFTEEDIANTPRILAASQKTVKFRLEKLRQLGFQEISLNVLCRSKKQFNKFCETYKSDET